jgi:hypothetical protein
MALPTITVEMDLNGTGTLVDVSADWDGDTAAIVHQWGRTDWAADQPNPGTLTATLRNLTGKYTPGNPTSPYSVGVAAGVKVRFTIGTRVRWFVCGAPQLRWDNNNANSSTITVVCTDLIGTVSQRTMRTMLDEEVALSKPLWYWRLDESGIGLQPRGAESSGNGGPALVPHGAADSYSWAQNSGPYADSGGGLGLSMSATDDPPQGRDYLSADGMAPVVLPGRQVTISCWVAPRLPPNYMGVGYLLWQLNCGGYNVAAIWNGSDRVFVQTDAGPSDIAWGFAPGKTTYFAVSLTWAATGLVVAKQVNDQLSTLTLTGETRTPRTLNGVWIGGGSSLLAWGSAANMAGSVARVAVYAGPMPANATDQYNVGQWGLPELPSARLVRLSRYASLTCTAQGTDRGDVVGQQDTSGQSMLAAMCDALRTEDAAIQTAGDPSSSWLEPWLYSTQRPGTSALTVNLDDDQDGPPTFSFDTSGVADVVTVTSHSVSATWVYTGTQLTGRNLTVSSALVSTSSAQNLAQYRAALGRSSTAIPSQITVDVATATNALAASLLTLRPGARVTITGCPTSILGYSTVDALVVGVTETYTSESARYVIALQSLLGGGSAFTLDDATLGLLDGDAANALPSTITSGATSIAVSNDSVTHFSTATPYPIRIDAEQMTVTAVSQAAGTDTLTVTRGVNGTTAASHSAGALVTVPGTGTLTY